VTCDVQVTLVVHLREVAGAQPSVAGERGLGGGWLLPVTRSHVGASMLHRFSDATDFDLRRQIAELEMITSSPSAAKVLAENYVGLPLT
jgi:hypothetical protein